VSIANRILLLFTQKANSLSVKLVPHVCHNIVLREKSAPHAPQIASENSGKSLRGQLGYTSFASHAVLNIASATLSFRLFNFFFVGLVERA
jgi:hypothetical protein